MGLTKHADTLDRRRHSEVALASDDRPIGFVRATIARGLQQFLVACYPHVSAERVLRHAGITPQVLADPDGMIDFKLWVELAELAAAETGDPALAANYISQMPLRDFGVLRHVIFNSPTLGAGLVNGCRYLGLHQNVARPWLDVGRSQARMIYRLDHPALPNHAQHSEGSIMLILRICREGLQNPAWAPREVQFAHRRPRSIDAHVRLFRCPISFDQPIDALVVSSAELDEPMRGADPELLPILLQHADACLAKLTFDGDFMARVTRAVFSSLSAGEVTIEHIATQLGASPRTIQRRLREHGQSFKDVVHRARLSLSKRYLGDPTLTLTETAFLLGYSQLSAFSRAFRKWTGRSATEFRREQLRSP